MASEGSSGGVVVDSCFIGGEIVVDGECSLDWSVGHYFSLDFGDLGRDGVDGGGSPFVVGVGGGVAVGAGSFAVWGWHGSTAGLVLACGMVVTGGQGVGHTPI